MQKYYMLTFLGSFCFVSDQIDMSVCGFCTEDAWRSNRLISKDDSICVMALDPTSAQLWSKSSRNNGNISARKSSGKSESHTAVE